MANPGNDMADLILVTVARNFNSTVVDVNVDMEVRFDRTTVFEKVDVSEQPFAGVSRLRYQV